MKKLKDIFESTLELDEKYKVGDNVQFNLDDVARANKGKQVNDDSGVVVSVSGDSYVLALHLDKTQVKVTGKNIIGFGSAGADNQT
jgi:ribosomal protein L21E